MATPEFYYFIRPTLEVVVANPGIHWKDAAEHAAKALKLTDQDKLESIPSGQPKWLNRVMWALTYLRQAKLVEKAGRGISNPTQRGVEFLAVAPNPIKPADLMAFPEFSEFWQGTKGNERADVSPPQEALALRADHCRPHAQARLRGFSQRRRASLGPIG